MKSKILNEVFAEFCESRRHLDSLLSSLSPVQKPKTAALLSMFLRRPWTLAEHFHIRLADSPEEFWAGGFLKHKKNPGIHAVLTELWEKWEGVPREGGRSDFPPSLVEEWERDWGSDVATGLCRFLSQEPLTAIRFHRSAYGQDGLMDPAILAWLGSSELPKSRSGNRVANARIFKGFALVQQNEFFFGGKFEIQDEGSQLMAAFSLFPDEAVHLLSSAPMVGKAEANPFPSSRRSPPRVVVDACAGGGGKTLALSDLMNGKGRVFAYDVSDRKIRALKARTERAGENNIQAFALGEEAAQSLSPHHKTADLVLVDAPCSGQGVLRRNPDAKWNRKPPVLEEREGREEISDLQVRVLEDYSPLVAPGGRLVYGACTFNKRETTQQVEAFLKGHAEFTLEFQGYTGPYDTDGFYMASLVRKA